MTQVSAVRAANSPLHTYRLILSNAEDLTLALHVKGFQCFDVLGE